MSLRHRWHRVEAEHWVHRFLAMQTFLLVLWTLWTFAMGWAHGFVLFTVVPATFVALSGWLTAAWRRERPWAWYVAAVVIGLRFAGNGLALLDGDLGGVGQALLVFDGLLLAFLFHPGSRARMNQPVGADRGADSAAARNWSEPRGS